MRRVGTVVSAEQVPRHAARRSHCTHRHQTVAHAGQGLPIGERTGRTRARAFDFVVLGARAGVQDDAGNTNGGAHPGHDDGGGGFELDAAASRRQRASVERAAGPAPSPRFERSADRRRQPAAARSWAVRRRSCRFARGRRTVASRRSARGLRCDFLPPDLQPRICDRGRAPPGSGPVPTAGGPAPC